MFPEVFIAGLKNIPKPELFIWDGFVPLISEPEKVIVRAVLVDGTWLDSVLTTVLLPAKPFRIVIPLLGIIIFPVVPPVGFLTYSSHSARILFILAFPWILKP